MGIASLFKASCMGTTTALPLCMRLPKNDLFQAYSIYLSPRVGDGHMQNHWQVDCHGKHSVSSTLPTRADLSPSNVHLCHAKIKLCMLSLNKAAALSVCLSLSAYFVLTGTCQRTQAQLAIIMQISQQPQMSEHTHTHNLSQCLVRTTEKVAFCPNTLTCR